jgi:acyl-coenzyme A thioesterase PaaI-like protein
MRRQNIETVRRHFEEVNRAFAEGGDLHEIAERYVEPDCVAELGATGVLNGGTVGTLLDCHSAAAVVQQAVTRDPESRDHWVTSEYSVKLLRPTNPDVPLELFAEVVEWDGDRGTTPAELRSEGKVRASCEARFVRYVPRDAA